MQTPEPTAAAGQPATDPSRSAPKCHACRHIYEDDHAWCNHPAASVSLITGEPATSCTEMRKGSYRNENCGPDGDWFAPQDKPATVPSANAALPTIGAVLPDGGIFAGITRGVDGGPDCMLVLAEAKPADGISWQAAMAWAESLGQGGVWSLPTRAESALLFATESLGQGGVWSLPTRAESALLFANLRDQFEPRYYWTCEQSSRNDAWGQVFAGGLQYDDGKSFEGRARAVRRLPIQPFNHS